MEVVVICLILLALIGIFLLVSWLKFRKDQPHAATLTARASKYAKNPAYLFHCACREKGIDDVQTEYNLNCAFDILKYDHRFKNQPKTLDMARYLFETGRPLYEEIAVLSKNALQEGQAIGEAKRNEEKARAAALDAKWHQTVSEDLYNVLQKLRKGENPLDYMDDGVDIVFEFSDGNKSIVMRQDSTLWGYNPASNSRFLLPTLECREAQSLYVQHHEATMTYTGATFGNVSVGEIHTNPAHDELKTVGNGNGSLYFSGGKTALSKIYVGQEICKRIQYNCDWIPLQYNPKNCYINVSSMSLSEAKKFTKAFNAILK